MKTSIKILACLSVAAALCSCNEKATYTTNPFIRFDGASYAVSEDAGTVSIPVYAYNKTGNAISVDRAAAGPSNATFTVINGSAEKDVDFTVSPANGVLSFDNEGAAYIQITIDNKSGVYTGNLNFAIELTGAGDGFTLPGEAVSSTLVTIKDLDHPLSAILGTYKTPVVADNRGDEYVITSTVEPVDGSVSEVTISNICPYSVKAGYAHKLQGYVSEDRKTLTVPSEQWIVKGGLLFVALDANGNLIDALEFDIDEEAHTLTTKSLYGAMTADGWYDLFPYAGIVFTKE